VEQIAGSRIVLKDGVRQLATRDLVAWWPFLVAAVVVYGWLPRSVLWITCQLMIRRTLRGLDFHDVACDRLYERLCSASLQIHARGREPERTELPLEEVVPTGAGASIGRTTLPSSGAVILASPDLGRRLDKEALGRLIATRFLLRPEVWLEWSEAAEVSRSALEALAGMNWWEAQPRVLLLEEAWQPPIAETLQGLRSLRATLGGNAKLIVALIGRPSRDRAFTPAKAIDLRIWRERLQLLADPHLRVEPLLPPAESVESSGG